MKQEDRMFLSELLSDMAKDAQSDGYVCYGVEPEVAERLERIASVIEDQPL